RPFAAKERAYDFFRRAIEERVDEMAERRLPRSAPRDGGCVDVPQPFLLVADVTFRFENAELRTNGGIGPAFREVFHHLSRRRPSAPVEDVHDLPFAPRQRGMGGVCPGGHHVMPVAYVL